MRYALAAKDVMMTDVDELRGYFPKEMVFVHDWKGVTLQYGGESYFSDWDEVFVFDVDPATRETKPYFRPVLVGGLRDLIALCSPRGCCCWLISWVGGGTREGYSAHPFCPISRTKVPLAACVRWPKLVFSFGQLVKNFWPPYTCCSLRA